VDREASGFLLVGDSTTPAPGDEPMRLHPGHEKGGKAGDAGTVTQERAEKPLEVGVRTRTRADVGERARVRQGQQRPTVALAHFGLPVAMARG
jgi:hypothetical protein